MGKKKGNKRSEINTKKEPKGAATENIGETLAEIRDTEDIDVVIALTKHENAQVRLKASQQMCPCRVKTD